MEAIDSWCTEPIRTMRNASERPAGEDAELLALGARAPDTNRPVCAGGDPARCGWNE